MKDLIITKYEIKTIIKLNKFIIFYISRILSTRNELEKKKGKNIT